MAQLRLFVAVKVPDELGKRLADMERRLAATGADVKWVPESNFHLTLKFLGNVDEARVKAVWEALAPAVSRVQAFDVCLAGAGAFPNKRRASVIWAGIRSGAEQIKALAQRVEDALEKIGFERESRPFKAHLTLGRARSPRNADKLGEMLDAMKAEEVGTFTVSAITLVKSDLRPSGPVYTTITEHEMVVDA